jgi:Protein of unknown function (DUF1759)
VAEITISNDEYNTAWNLLLQHYNNPLKIIKSYIQPLFERQDGLESLEETQKTVMQINRITRGLQKLGKIGTAETPWILAVLLTRCDQETADLWQLMTSKDKYSVESFMEFAKKRIKGENGNKVLIYNMAQVPNIRKMSCPLCRKPHALHGCKEFREKGNKRSSSICIKQIRHLF